MKRNSIGLAILVTLFANSVMAEPITGGFGLTLGTKLNVNSSLATNIERFPNTIFHVQVPKPIDGFDEYEVYVTPESHTIYQIKAIRYYKYLVDARVEFDVLEEILRDKYTVPIKRTTQKVAQRHQPEAEGGGRISEFRRGGTKAVISLYDGRRVKKLNPNIRNYDIPSRVVITYYSEDVQKKSSEFKDLRPPKNRPKRDTSKLAADGRAIL